MKEVKFYRCSHCGNIVEKIIDSKVPVVCCGEPMKELIPNTSDGAGEKHVPVVEVEGNKVVVKVGEVDHPMIPAHYIQWIYVVTTKGIMRKDLTSDNAPKAEFTLDEDEKVLEVYESCNLHGLWKTVL